MRGFLISLQQLTTTIGIMVAYWVGVSPQPFLSFRVEFLTYVLHQYGSNYIGGAGKGQSNFAWRLPMIIQGIPAIVLCVGLFFMPFSPRLLVNKGKEKEALKTLSYLRNLPEDHFLVQVELLEIKADVEFERAIFDRRFPELSKAVGDSVWRREFAQYSNIFRSRDNFKRVVLGSLVMFFQQWTGIDSSKCHRLQFHESQVLVTNP